MTSMISDYPKSIPPVVADFGWYYGTQPLASQATIQRTNLIPNPSFEYDTVGAAPIGVSPSAPGFQSTFAVQSGWSSQGSRSLRVTTTTMTTTNQASPVLGSSAGWAVTPGQNWAVLANWNVLAAAGAPYIAIETWWYNASGTFLTAQNTGPSATVGTYLGVSAVVVAPVNAAYLIPTLTWGASSPSTSIDFYVDGIMLAKAAAVPVYHDGDSPGWAWSGAAGNSTSIDQKDDFVTPLNQIITFDAIDQQGLGMPHVITPPGVSIVDYKWDFGNGQVAHGPFAATTYNYSKPPPDMQASLTVTDSHNRVYSCAHRLNLQALTPVYATTLRERG